MMVNGGGAANIIAAITIVVTNIPAPKNVFELKNNNFSATYLTVIQMPYQVWDW
jgi:hypothetical protein